MNILHLKEEPTDLTDYIKAKKFGSLGENESNLRELVKQGTSNIAATGFSIGIIMDIEAELTATGYQVFMVPITGMTAFANFYLKNF